MKEIKILPSIATTHECDYMGRAEEALDLGIGKVAFFPTTIERAERNKIYKILEGKIAFPQVHLRHDMDAAELDYLISSFKTELFNIHPIYEKEFSCFGPKYTKQIYVENYGILSEDFMNILDRFDGLCLDTSHFEDEWYGQKRADNRVLADNIKKIKIGCCHIGPVIWDTSVDAKRKYRSAHRFSKLSEFDYLSKFINLLPPIASIEVENSIPEQLQARDYIDKMIDAYY